jgi:hypothetical protein
MLLQGADEIELLVTMPGRDEPAQVRVPMKVLHQENGPVFAVNELASQNGLDPCFHGFLDKKDRSVESVGIRQGQVLHPACPRSQAQVFESGNPPSLGIVGMDV